MRYKNAIMLFVILLPVVTLFAAMPEAFGGSATPPAGTIDVTSWIPLASAAVFVVIAIAAMVYMLAGVVGSSAARNWSKMQIYEALLSVFFLLLFGAFSYFASLSPQQGFGALNLVPSQCTSAGTLTNLAVCDLSSFDISAYGAFDVIYYVTFITGFTPGLSVNIFFPAGRQAAPQTSGTASPNLLPANQNPLLNVSFQLGSLYPQSMTKIMSTAYSAILTLTMLNQVQLLLLSGSTLFLTVFMILGLVARIFGISRSFGGAMIAFGLGLGIVYPLLVSITYGFIVPNIAPFSNYLSDLGNMVTTVTGFATSLIATTGGCLASSIISGAAPSVPVSCTLTDFIPTNILDALVYLGAGFTFIPFINFTILDAFIVDFSRSIGERVDFMSLLSSVI